MWVYVIYENFGYEGFGSPRAVKLTMGSAKEWLLKRVPDLYTRYPHKTFDEDRHFCYYMNRSDPIKAEGWIIEGLQAS